MQLLEVLKQKDLAIAKIIHLRIGHPIMIKHIPHNKLSLLLHNYLTRQRTTLAGKVYRLGWEELGDWHGEMLVELEGQFAGLGQAHCLEAAELGQN